MLIGCVWCGERNKWIKRTVLMRKGKKDKRVSGVGDKSRAKEIDVSIAFYVASKLAILLLKIARDFAERVSPGIWF